MKYIKKFGEVFEGYEGSNELFSPNFRKIFKQELSSIKDKMKYFLNRGFNGYFDLVEIDGKNHPSLFFDGSEEPLVQL
jgi:hypothetical protein